MLLLLMLRPTGAEFRAIESSSPVHIAAVELACCALHFP